MLPFLIPSNCFAVLSLRQLAEIYAHAIGDEAAAERCGAFASELQNAIAAHGVVTHHAGSGFMHESFHKDDPARFTRSWFGWVNSLFGELVLDLWSTNRSLLG